MRIQSFYKNINKFDYPILCFDLNYRVRYMNLPFQKIFNVTRKELQNKSGAAFFGEKSFAGYIKRHIDNSAEGTVVSHIDALRDFNGITQSMTMEYFPMLSEYGDTQRVLILFRNNIGDTTTRNGNKADYHEIIDTLNAFNEALFITNANFEITFSNQKARELFSKSGTPITGRKCYEVIFGYTGPHDTCPLVKNRKGYHLNDEPRIFYENGNIIRITPIRNTDGEISSILHQIIPNYDDNKDYLLHGGFSMRDFDRQLHNNFDGFRKRLSERYPHLTQHNLKHCTLIRMNFTTKEIAEYFHVSPASVQRARVRLKKKLNLPKEESLFHFLFHF